MSVAHELGHLILHRYVTSGTQELETNAYSFASELLMPSNAILGDLTAEKLNLFRFAKLKSTWGVSMQALTRRSRELEVINDRQYRYLMRGSLPCTKMQQPKEGLSPNAVISYNVARR
jgi:Zn-dependent peptidase ImmA (M78 family)